jgi:predicted metalloprotease with PDZ domain
VSYYAKGSLVGCALDLVLRRDCNTTLDELMRALWQRYGRTGIGVPEDAIPRLASELAGRDLDPFFARYVYGTEDPPLAELLADFGVTLHWRAAAGPKDRGGKPDSGVAPRCTLGVRLGPDLRLGAVLRDGPAARAGLSGNDVLVAIDGLKATPERIASTLTRAAPGDTVDVHAFRRDELSCYVVTLDAAAEDTCYMTLDAAPAPQAEARRGAWLRGESVKA